jgi:hypothetical protein
LFPEIDISKSINAHLSCLAGLNIFPLENSFNTKKPEIYSDQQGRINEHL